MFADTIEAVSWNTNNTKENGQKDKQWSSNYYTET